MAYFLFILAHNALGFIGFNRLLLKIIIMHLIYIVLFKVLRDTLE